MGQGRSEDFEIAVQRWSRDEEHDHLRKALSDGGVAALSRAIGDLTSRVGVVRTPREGTLGLKYAREAVTPDGRRRLLLVTDRLSAPATKPRADTHDFLVVEVVLDEDGKGQGRTAAPEEPALRRAQRTLSRWTATSRSRCESKSFGWSGPRGDRAER